MYIDHVRIYIYIYVYIYIYIYMYIYIYISYICETQVLGIQVVSSPPWQGPEGVFLILAAVL